ncbi:uncharacterized protein J8A68_001735 [[Candida] subhashii]|uniref:C2H2-type domain-containing protein n=1 Tax=[Candida] subhashii TaxID=561895 RepID=A0A8J5QQE8_9ASCO|nr:uncharacterized protein J8A68_001735 [[Candida] subhashii]KAG7664710.1 hypothetical protein J8A68_001735 [[Candida] subhashii]
MNSLILLPMYAEQFQIRESNNTTPVLEDLTVEEFEKSIEEFEQFLQQSADHSRNGSNAATENNVWNSSTNYSTASMTKQDSTLSIPTTNDSTYSHSRASGTTPGSSSQINLLPYATSTIHGPPLIKIDSFLSVPSRSTSRSISPNDFTNLEVTPPPSGIMGELDTNEISLLAGYFDTTNDCINLSDLFNSPDQGDPKPLNASLNPPIFDALSTVNFASSSNIEEPASAIPSLFRNNWSLKPANVPRSFPEIERSCTFRNIPNSYSEVEEGSSSTTTTSRPVSASPINNFQSSPPSLDSPKNVLPRTKMLKLVSGTTGRYKTAPKHPAIYQCDVCGRRYTRQSNCNSHVKTHSGERPFMCSNRDCDSSFYTKYDCKRHEDLHTNRNKFLCKGVLEDGTEWGCGKGFPRLESLRRHFKTIKGKKCKRRFMEEERRKKK